MKLRVKNAKSKDGCFPLSLRTELLCGGTCGLPCSATVLQQKAEKQSSNAPGMGSQTPGCQG